LVDDVCDVEESEFLIGAGSDDGEGEDTFDELLEVVDELEELVELCALVCVSDEVADLVGAVAP
jgi:hypothetical protein